MTRLQPIPVALDSLEPVLAEALSTVVDRVAAHLRSGEPSVDELVDHATRYHGKLLRPALVLLSGLAAHPRARETADAGALLGDEHLTVAAVLEMIHLATLVHDDVLDDADVRRGSPTIHRVSGTERAVILGDYLFARSYHLCSTLDDQRVALRVGEISSIVCRGEMLQLTNAGNAELDEDTYLRIIDGKTGALIAAACELGAHVSGADPEICHRMLRFGELVGRAFQIQDDLLDLTGDEQTVGKSTGRDIETGKLTLPLIHYLRSSGHADPHVDVRDLVHRQVHLNGERVPLLRELERAGSLDYAHRCAHRLAADAAALLERLPETPASQALAAMADAAVRRTR
ncbi:MAG: polyprenyl synthetase family protein [Planctomycetota bacterium]